MKHFRIIKYEGKGTHDYAVFHRNDVMGLYVPYFYAKDVPSAIPIVCGCSRKVAEKYVKEFEKEIKRASKKTAPKGKLARRTKKPSKRKPTVRKASKASRTKSGGHRRVKHKS